MGAGLRLLLALAALWGARATEKIRGTLGEATLLRIPAWLQERTEEFGEASWKRSTEDPQKKKFLLKLSNGNYTEFERGRVRFHPSNFSLEILNTSRDDQRLYEYSVSKGQDEELWEIQLEVFEPVADPSIRILGLERSNGSCSLALLCGSARGDAVSYSWSSRDGGAGAACSGSGAFLNLSFPLRSAAFRCVCTASNPVSSRHAAFHAAPQCGSEPRGGPRTRPELLALLLPLGAIIIIIIILAAFRMSRATHRAKGDQEPSPVTPEPSPVTPEPSLVTPEPSPVTPDSGSATVYAQVQRVQKPQVPKATPVSSTTIYTVATGPAPAPRGAPRAPAQPPAPRGQSPLSQEPTTVYASVTLPLA